MRDTDLRMAKYGRRGLISNFLVFTLCLFTSETFVAQQAQLATTLSIGLLVTTLIRGYFLFRIDTIYPRGPTAWRNKYFIATLSGAVWWCVIMVSITHVLKMLELAPLMWLYTVVFFSTTAHAFSPFKNFLAIYQFIGIVPAALSIVFLGDALSFFYCLILLMFYWILTHHSELMSKAYWGHLEANYALARKAESLEAEKRGTRASVQLSNEYLGLLAQKIAQINKHENTDKAPANHQPIAAKSAQKANAFAPMQTNIEAFLKIVNKDFTLEHRIFNVRRYLQFLVGQQQKTAEKNGVTLETAVAPALPPRLVGDVEKLGQIIQYIVGAAVEQVKQGSVFVEMEFAREYETSGQLLLTLACQSSALKRKFFNDQQVFVIQPSLNLALAKGMSEAMGGTLDIGDAVTISGKSLCLRLGMTIAEVSPRLDYHRVEYKNRPILLIDNNVRWLDHKRFELDTLGFDVQTLTDYKKAVPQLLQTINSGQLALSVVYSVKPGDSSAIEFANELIGHSDLKHTHQFVVSSQLGKQYFNDGLTEACSTIHYVAKPSGLFEFEVAASQVFRDPILTDTKNPVSQNVVWITLGKKSSSHQLYESELMHIHRVEDLKHLDKKLTEFSAKLVVIENCDGQVLDIVRAVRDWEANQRAEALVPIVAVGAAANQRLMLEAGVDHFANAESVIAGEESAFFYWLTGQYAE